MTIMTRKAACDAVDVNEKEDNITNTGKESASLSLQLAVTKEEEEEDDDDDGGDLEDVDIEKNIAQEQQQQRHKEHDIRMMRRTFGGVLAIVLVAFCVTTAAVMVARQAGNHNNENNNNNNKDLPIYTATTGFANPESVEWVPMGGTPITTAPPTANVLDDKKKDNGYSTTTSMFRTVTASADGHALLVLERHIHQEQSIMINDMDDRNADRDTSSNAAGLLNIDIEKEDVVTLYRWSDENSISNTTSSSSSSSSSSWYKAHVFASPLPEAEIRAVASSGHGRRVALATANYVFLYDWNNNNGDKNKEESWQLLEQYISVAPSDDTLNIASIDLDYEGHRLAVGVLPNYYASATDARDNDFSNAFSTTTKHRNGHIQVYQYDATTSAASGNDNDKDSNPWRLQALLEESAQANLGSLVHLSSDGQVLVDGTFWANHSDTANGGVFQMTTGQVASWTTTTSTKTVGHSEEWHPQATLLAGSTPLGGFGDALALSADGRFLAVASPGYKQSTGAVYVYQRVELGGSDSEKNNNNRNHSWQLRASLVAGLDKQNDTQDAMFGSGGLCLSADGNLLTVADRVRGAVQVYQYSNDIGEYISVGEEMQGPSASFGKSLACAANGNIVAVLQPPSNIHVFQATED